MFDFSQFVSLLGQTAQKRLFDSKLRLILRKTVQGYSNSVRALQEGADALDLTGAFRGKSQIRSSPEHVAPNMFGARYIDMFVAAI